MRTAGDPETIPGPLGARPRRARAAFRRAAGPLLVLAREAGSRAADVALSSAVLAALAPALLLRALVARARTGRVLERTALVGRYRRPFEALAFADDAPGRGLPALLNVLRGDRAIVGPRALTPAEAADGSWQPRFEVRPGLVSRYSLKRRTGVAHESEAAADRELVYGQSLRGDLGIMARAVPLALLGADAGEAPPELDVLGVRIVNTTMAEALDWIVEGARGRDRRLLAFVNPDCLNIAVRDPAYRGTLTGAARVLPDGIGLHLAGKLLGTPLRENVNGTDLFPLLCERLASTDLSVYLLGARPGIADEAARRMQERYPGLRVAGIASGYFSGDEEEAVVDAINRSGAGVLLVAMGVPRQEAWLARWHDRLAPPVRMGVGGLFDFYSGRIPRAPAWLRELGLEWTYRLRQEPGRMWRRYVIGNPQFLWRVYRQARAR
jgi:N-acetylglucosaminyldiphosphoundecaprenol N-acetyl-beta-D-mannosaminyltransferase